MIRTLVVVLIGWSSHGCAAPETAEVPLAMVTHTLPEGVMDELYVARLQAQGGVGPTTWVLAGDLPQGLVFNPEAGSISGIPNRAASSSLTVVVTDGAGATDQAELDLTIDDAGRLTCGDTWTGSIPGSNITPSGVIDWDRQGSVPEATIALPPRAFTRVGTSLPSSLFVALVHPEKPRYPSLAGFWATSRESHLDALTSPSLDAYRAYGNTVSLAILSYEEEPVEFELPIECSDGPLFHRRWFPPVRLGEPVYVDYDVVGSNDDVVFTLHGSVPHWARLEPATGRLTGLPDTAGSWLYDIRATTSDGRQTQVTTGFGVYDPVHVDCHTEALSLAAGTSFRTADQRATANTDGWFSLQLAVPDDVSLVHFDLDLPPGSTWTIVNPGQPPWDLSGTLRRTTTAGKVGPSSLSVGPRTAPRLGAFGDTVHATLYQTSGRRFDEFLQIRCDRSPRVGRAELPVLDGDDHQQVALPVIGGTPPVTFSSSPLPPGVTLSSDGLLTSTGVAPWGASTVNITLTDAIGASSSDQFTLWIDEGTACGRGVPLLDCGDSADLALHETRDEPAFCLATAVMQRSWVALDVSGDGVYRLSDGPLPSTSPDEDWRASVSHVVSEHTTPSSRDLAGTVTRWFVESSEGNPALVRVQCGH